MGRSRGRNPRGVAVAPGGECRVVDDRQRQLLPLEGLPAGGVEKLQAPHTFTRPYGHSNERRAQLRPFLNHYNCVRPHWGIGRKTPQQRRVDLRVTNVLGSNS